MKIHRFFLNNTLGEDLKIEEKGLLHQMNTVLKFKIGESIAIFNSLNTFDYIYNIKNIDKKSIFLSFNNKEENLSQDIERNIVNLYISLIKKDNLDLILTKCTEIGIFSFTPIISERVEKKNIASFNKKRGEKIIIEAIEQSGWRNVPNIFDLKTLEEALKGLQNKSEIENTFILDIGEVNNMRVNKNEAINLFIGPEGGWTENERELFKKYKIKTISFGKNVLRAETAAIVGAFKFTEK